jgi:hypothetical protein
MARALVIIKRSLLLRGHFPPEPLLSLLPLVRGRAGRRRRAVAPRAARGGGGERGQKAAPLALAARGSSAGAAWQAATCVAQRLAM